MGKSGWIQEIYRQLNQKEHDHVFSTREKNRGPWSYPVRASKLGREAGSTRRAAGFGGEGLEFGFGCAEL